MISDINQVVMAKPLSSGISDKVNKDFKIHYGLKLWYDLREIHYKQMLSTEDNKELLGDRRQI